MVTIVHNRIHLFVSLINNNWDVGFPSVAGEEISAWVNARSIYWIFFFWLFEKIYFLLSLHQNNLSHSCVLFDSIPILLRLFVYIREIADGTQLFPWLEPISGIQLLGHFMAIIAALFFNIQK